MEAGRRHVALAVMLAFLLLLVPISGCASAPESDGNGDGTEVKEPYRIGAVLSLSGTFAGLGEPEKNTIEMEVERINADGGINGRPLEVVYEDDKTDSEAAVAATSRLIDREGVLAIIGSSGTGATMGMRGEINRAGIAQVSLAGGTVITAEFDPLVFQTPWSNSLVVPFTLEYLQNEGITKVGLITDTGGFGADGQAVIKAAASDFGIEILAEETFNQGDTDMSGQLTKIKSSGAEAVVMWTAGREAATIAKNLADLGLGIPLIGSHGNARVEMIEGAAGAAEGFRFAAGKVLIPESYGPDTENFAVATDFIERYTDRYGKAPDTFAGHAFDGLYLIVDAMKRLDEGFTAADLRDEIEATRGFVGIGGTFTFSSTDHNGLTADDLVVYEVKDGAWVLAE
ncbi:MAG: ABC transporter substrate-binding protein [Coriobacteriia bacterium]|nr:ABC transporter substrate-binding protein [Coriobacteriia bacterium]